MLTRLTNYPLTGLLLNITFSLVLLNGCTADKVSTAKAGDQPQHRVLGSAAAVSFDRQGTLWRLIPTKDAVYVDYSTDQGRSFSEAVQVNPSTQKISAWPENPPAIVAGPDGRIHVLYFADAEQKSTTYYSYSDDRGRSFSQPVLISDQAGTAMHYMDEMLVNDQGRVFIFWHDTRTEEAHPPSGVGELALYYAVTGAPENGLFINKMLTGSVCSCCRTAAALDPEGRPVLLMRMVMAGGRRDHALIRMKSDQTWNPLQPLVRDDWVIAACPEHGPALAIDDRGRSHFTWFTLGERRQGIFYAYSDDYGLTVSEPVPLGNPELLPGHADVLTLDNRVLLVWKTYDGKESAIWLKTSGDRGVTWTEETQIASSAAKSGYPALLSHGQQAYLSWTSVDTGHRILPLN